MRTIARSRRAALGALLLASPALAQPLSVTYRNQVSLGAGATDQYGASFAVTGLSGLTHLAGDQWIAVMDNSNRLVRLTITLTPTGSIASAAVTAGITLAQTHDFEDVAFTTTQRNSVFLSEEDTPGVREFSLETGLELQNVPIPPVFGTRRANFGFESMSRRADGRTLWTANEEALSVDGPVSTPTNGTTVRLLRFTPAAGGAFVPGPQYAYTTQPMHAGAIANGRSGLCALVALPDGRLLALERSLALNLGMPFQVRIYQVHLDGATDVSSYGSGLIGQFTQAGKTLLWSGGNGINNMEGLALGPALGLGGHALLGVVDDGDPSSTNRLVAFVLGGAIDPCPGDWNLDHEVNSNDVSAFLDQWFADQGAGTAETDVDASGEVNSNDVTTFLNAWFTAC